MVKMRKTRQTRTWKRCRCRNYCQYLYFCTSKVLNLLAVLQLKALADVSALEEELKTKEILCPVCKELKDTQAFISNDSSAQTGQQAVKEGTEQL